MLNLPTHLTIEHLLQKDRKIKATVKKVTLKEPLEEHEISQIESILKMLISDSETAYDSEFVRIFLLIKINSLLQKQCNINQEFINELIKIYNSGRILNIQHSKSDDEFFSQVILEGNLHKYIQIRNVDNVLGGQCLLATSLALIAQETQNFMTKAELTFALSFLALSGKPQAFVPVVHIQKNHQGEIKFAAIIQKYIQIDKPEKHRRILIQSRVQDSYSMRCSPQVYGVVYECLQFIKKDLDSILNRFHFRTVLIDGKEFPNIGYSADSEVLKGDFLVCSLNEIGSMCFLRAERILNIYLGKNQLHKQNPKEVFELKAVLQKRIHLVADNKLLSAPSNGDTMNIGNYEKDVYFNPYKVFEKFTKMISNLYKLMLLEVQTAILGLKNIYSIGQGEIFLNQTIKNNFFKLDANCCGKPRKGGLFYIKSSWKVDGQAENMVV